MKKFFMLVAILMPMCAHAIKDKNQLYYELMSMINTHAEKYGERAIFDNKTYGDDLLNGFRSVCKDVVTWCSVYGDFVVPADKTLRELNCKDLQCNCDKTHPTDCPYMAIETLMCVQSMPERKDVVASINDDTIKKAKNACEGQAIRYLRKYSSYTKETQCNHIGDNRIKCVVSGKIDTSGGAVVYSQCCAVEPLQDGRTIISVVSPLKQFTEKKNLVELDDYDDMCQLTDGY